MKHALSIVAGLLVALAPAMLWAAEPDGQVPVAVPYGAGAAGTAGGAFVAWWVMHGRVKVVEEAMRTMAPQLPGLVAELRNAVDDFKAAIKAARESEVQLRGKLHDVRDTIQKHEGRFIRIEERFNGLRDVVAGIKGSEAGIPRPLTDDITGPIADTGKHRSVHR